MTGRANGMRAIAPGFTEFWVRKRRSTARPAALAAPPVGFVASADDRCRRLGPTRCPWRTSSPVRVASSRSVTAAVRGEQMDVFVNRLPHLRAALEAAGGVRRSRVLRLRRRRTPPRGDPRRASPGRGLRRAGAARGVRRRSRETGSRSLRRTAPSGSSTFWAAISLGAIAVGLNGWWVGDEIRYGLADCDADVLVADRKRLDRLEGEDPGVPTIVIEDDFDRLWHAYPDAPLPGPAHRGGRPRDHPVHERNDGTAEGRGQHASQRDRRDRHVVLPRCAPGDAEGRPGRATDPRRCVNSSPTRCSTCPVCTWVRWRS